MSHVAQLITSLDRIGGAEQQVRLLARGLKQRGWRVSVIALTGSGGPAGRELAAAGIEFVSLGMRKGLADPRGWLRFHRWLRRATPDVVHSHLPHSTLLARWTRITAPMPVLIDTLHSSATGGRSRRFGYRLSSFLADRVTAVSDAAAQAHIAAGTVPCEKLMVMPNGIEPERWRPDSQLRVVTRRDLSLTDEFLWLAAGRLEPVKDYPTLLRAMALLPQSARLIVAGSGWQESQLKALAAQFGVLSRVHFAGFVRDLERWMQAADAFVLCSRYEGLPTVLIEASAAGLPAVATDVPGVREALGRGVDEARLASPGDAAALACAMTGLMQIPAAERQAIGARARRFATGQFNLQTVLNRWERLYQDLLEGCPAPQSLSRDPAAN